MNYINKLLRSLHQKRIDRPMVMNLYSLSQKSLVAVVALSMMLTYYLYPSYSDYIVFWESIIILVSLFRLYFAYAYRENPKKFTLKIWYWLFVICALQTAVLFALLGSTVLLHVEAIDQVFITAVLIGLTSGAMSSLYPDLRIGTAYIAIILFPLIISLLWAGSTLNIVLALLVIIYFTTQIIIILNSYKQRNDLDKRKEEIYKEQIGLHKKEESLQYFFEQAPIGIISYDLELNITDCNQSIIELFGLEKEKVMNLNLNDLPDQRSIDVIRGALEKGTQVYVGPYKSIKGLELWVEVKCFPVYNYSQDVVGGVGLIENKTKEHTALKDLQYLALHDPLTSLLNRRGLKEYINTFMQKEEHKYYYSLLVYLDLNKFKHINDSLGHKVGDRLLISISDRLKIFLEERCIVSRFGGDEFIVVASFIAKSRSKAEKRSKECIHTIHKAFTDPFIVDDMHLSISTSLGVVIIEPNASNIDEIIRYADIAMYQAKENVGNHTSFYDIALDKERKKLFLLQHDLVHAVEKNELKFYLQPLVAMKENKIVASECLLRWEHPVLGFLSPAEFIPMSIETGLITDITWWLIEEICKYIATLKKEHIWTLNYISININAKQLLLTHFVKEFLGILMKYEVDTSDIMIEITERSLIDNFEDTQCVIDDLRKKGIKCAIDDFGIGYSSLSYLKKLSFDTLKIDIEFVKDIMNRPDDIALIKTILEIGRQFNYHIVVEGIEEERQKELLLEIDEDLIYQGFLFSKPLPHEVFTEKYLKD